MRPPTAMQHLLESIRKASLPGIWSQGVKLAREGRVSRTSATAAEHTLRVRSPGLTIAPTVTLYLQDEEWACDCGGKVDPCAHVVAAAIASAQEGTLERTTTPGAEPSLPGSPGRAQEKALGARLVYRFGKKDRLLTLSRFVVHQDGREERIASLASDLARGKIAPGVAPTHEDLLVDRILGNPPREVVPVVRMKDILQALSNCPDLTLHGQPVRASGEGVVPRAVVEDAPGGGFVLRIDRDPKVTEVVAMGAVRCGNVLHPIAESATCGDFLERLPISRKFNRDQATELVTVTLPEVEKRFPVQVVTKKLPRTSKDARPRISMDLSHHGHTLSILPTLVYGDPPIARVDGDEVTPLGNDVPLRKREAERELLRKLRDDLNLVPGRRVDLDGSEAIRFAAKLRDWQKRVGDDSHAAVFENRQLRPLVTYRDGALDIVFQCEDVGQDEEPLRVRADAATVLRAFRDGLDLVPLDGGGWAPLPAGWLAEHGQRVADLLAARDGDKKLAAAALPELGMLCDALNAPKPLGLDKLMPLLDGFASIPEVPLPEGVTASLRAYQQVGVNWLSFLQTAKLGAVLADDMGLGKTLQTICVLKGRCLVVCPRSVVYNWAEEIARFRPALRTSIYHGTRRELSDDADVTLTTYAVLRLDTERLAARDWDVVVLDEAQSIKNAASQTARAAFELKGSFRVALSGTPVENRLEELWSAMHFANPGLLGGRSDFQERYSGPIAAGDRAAAARLRTKIRPFVLRRMKREVLPELPSRTDSVLHVELDEVERSVYDAVRVATKKEVAEKLLLGGGVLAALEALLRLRQAACHAQLVPGQSADTSSKIERLLEALEEATSEGHKALVFSQWTKLLDLVEPHLDAAGIRFTRLDGSTRDRGGVVASFQDDAGPPVMLVSLKAGGTGLNLTAADHVFLLDPWWNPAVEDQAADRAHRMGQERPVMVYRMVAKDTVEERILALQERKRALADVALGNADHGGGITRDDLLALLE